MIITKINTEDLKENHFLSCCIQQVGWQLMAFTHWAEIKPRSILNFMCTTNALNQQRMHLTELRNIHPSIWWDPSIKSSMNNWFCCTRCRTTDEPSQSLYLSQEGEVNMAIGFNLCIDLISVSEIHVSVELTATVLCSFSSYWREIEPHSRFPLVVIWRAES